MNRNWLVNKSIRPIAVDASVTLRVLKLSCWVAKEKRKKKTYREHIEF